MKKSIFIIFTLLFIMVGTIVFGASFSDVNGTKYQSAVELLASLKIVNGKTATTFAPNDNVKRSEMAKMLVVALGRESDAEKAKGKTKFPDVVENHWASGYINMATELGIIKGYPDGTFAPDDNVSYVESLTMLLRALNYEDVNSLTWPTGYINRGKEIGLVKNVSISDYDKGAIRGDVAILVNNTLMANTREITGSNDKGMIYGNGKPLISKTNSNYEYYGDVTVSDLDEYTNKITVTDSKNKNYTLQYSGKDILSLYGKQVSILYDKKNEKILNFEIDSSYSTVSGSVTKVESKKIYIKKVEYSLPASSKILLIGISSISDAEEAYLTIKNNVVTHVVAIGEEDLYIGIATAKTAKSNNKYKVTVCDEEDDEDTFVQADQTLTIKKNEVLIYALNEDDELVVRYSCSSGDGLKVESVTKTSIKLKGKTAYTFSSSDKFDVYEVDDGEISKAKYLTSIDTDYDTAVVIETRSKTFIIYFVDGVDEDDTTDENASSTIKVAKKRIAAAIKAANAIKEASYSVATYEKMLVKLEAAENAESKYASTTKDSSTAISALDRASLALENAIDALEKATSADKTLRSDFSKLTSKIKEAKSLAKNTEYTEASRSALSKVITTCEKITIASTTSAKIQTAINNLDDAIDNMMSTATQEEIAEIKSEILSLLSKAREKKESNYTKESYATLKEAIKAAEAIKDYTKERISKLTNISNNLSTALKNLVSYASQLLDDAKYDYKLVKAEVSELTKSNYTAKSWSNMLKYVVDIDVKYDEDDLLEDEYTKAISEVKALTRNLEDAIINLTYTEEYEEMLKIEEAKESLSLTITKAKKIKEADWSETDMTFSQFTSKISDAEKLCGNDSASLNQIETIEKELKAFIQKYL